MSKRFPRERLALSIVLATFALAAGCSEEGRIIEAQLPVSAIAFEQSFNDPAAPTDSMSRVLFKVDVHAANPCEAQHGFLELRLVVEGATETRIIRPVARYNTDSPCTAEPVAASDSVLRLTVTGIQVREFVSSTPDPILGNIPRAYQVETPSGPPIAVVIDSTYHTAANMVRFEVRVEAKATGAVVAGAAVAIDDMTTGSPVPLGNGTTDAGGLYALDVPFAGAAEALAFPYRVTATNGPDQTVFTVRSSPARVQCRERVVIRL